MIAPTNEHDWFTEHLSDAQEFIDGGDLKEVLTAARVQILVGIQENFINAIDPRGNAWVPRKHNYPWPILIKTTRMMRAAIGESGESINRVQPREMELGVSSSVFYAGIHNYGTPNMPQREFMGNTEEQLQLIDNVIANKLFEEAFGLHI